MIYVIKVCKPFIYDLYYKGMQTIKKWFTYLYHINHINVTINIIYIIRVCKPFLYDLYYKGMQTIKK
jgi:hypothetical protein